jgi:general secretion pathway protein A
LQVAGFQGAPTFTIGALWRIFHYTKGVPRLVNAICDKCLLAGYVHKKDTVDFGLAGIAIRELEGNVSS